MRTKLFLALALWVIVGAAAHAQSLDIVFNPSTQTGTPGGTVTYAGTITNNTASTIYVNQVTGDVGTASNNTVFNSDPYASNYAFDSTDTTHNHAFAYAPGTSFSGNLFDVNIASNETPGTYAGHFFLSYFDGTTTTIVGTQNFTLIVQASPAPPALVVTLLFGTCAMVVLRRGRGLRAAPVVAAGKA